jgi:hypothetical protein
MFIRVWKHVVQKGDTVIDATCGNGYDTFAMVNVRDIYWAMRPKPSVGPLIIIEANRSS